MDGTIVIQSDGYDTFYDFYLTDVYGTSYPLWNNDTYYVTAGLYFLRAVVKPEYYYIYGDTECTYSWIEVQDSDTTMTLTMIVRPTVQSYLKTITAGARIFGQWTDSAVGVTHSYKLFKSNMFMVLNVNNSTNPDGFIYEPAENDTYYAILMNSNGGHVVVGGINVKNENQPFNLSGIKQLFISEFKADLDWNNWSTSDEDYFVDSLDILKFQGSKIKVFTNANDWFSVPTNEASSFAQKMEKVRQGFVFNNTMTITITPSAYNKWVATGTLLEKHWVVVFEDNNGFWWVFGYQNEGSKVRAYKRSSEGNYYEIEFSSNSGNKILTAISYNDYVLPYIINS